MNRIPGIRIVVALIPVAVTAFGCGARSPLRGQTETTMPNPGGCFVQVWEQPAYAGVFDYINGPQRYPSLRDLPGGRVWSDRIQSAKVGPAASVILYSEENGQGSSMTLRPNADYPRLPDALAGRAKSASVMCGPQTAAAE
jgi:hypothetical protein